MEDATKVCHAQLSPDGKNLLTVEETTATVWNVDEKKPLYRLEEAIESYFLNTHNSFWSNNGKLIALPTSKDFAVIVFSDDGSKTPRTLSGHTREVISVAFSPHQTMLATASFDKTIRLYCLETGNCLNVLEGHTKLCANMFFTKDEQQVITPLVDGTVRVWDPQTGQCLKVLEGHKGEFLQVLFVQKQEYLQLDHRIKRLGFGMLTQKSSYKLCLAQAGLIKLLLMKGEKRWQLVQVNLIRQL
ncbi:MAG: hypothetical protein LVQ75_02750 [Candidatus Babeliales bacterium]|jgi:WD40 repeat protein